MKIAIYVQAKYAKQNYRLECFDTRQFAGIRVVKDILERAGHEVQYASCATVDAYDVVLVSITSDCDWWEFVKERRGWQHANCKVIVGGPGVLNVRPFLSLCDYFILGRAEGVIDNLIENIDEYEHRSVITADKFRADGAYMINQADEPYPHSIDLGKTQYTESAIGCPHRCRFCGYTYHRKNTATEFRYGDMWSRNKDVELSIIDMNKENAEVDYGKLRTTAIDGCSERLRLAVKKNITRDMLTRFLTRLSNLEKPHQVKLYNIVGYPDETQVDYDELIEDIQLCGNAGERLAKQTSLLLHNTPFRAMPATPLACARMSYKNYRGLFANMFREYRGNIFFQGNRLWAVESMGVESLASVALSAIIIRGTEKDADNIARVAMSSKFSNASAYKRVKTLERYFDMDRLFGAFNANTLPTRYLRTYCGVEKTYPGAGISDAELRS
jgi:radical SAM superfamily enzyme YgiQ (UPF0313 family)